jgi:hypothetical protein
MCSGVSGRCAPADVEPQRASGGCNPPYANETAGALRCASPVLLLTGTFREHTCLTRICPGGPDIIVDLPCQHLFYGHGVHEFRSLGRDLFPRERSLEAGGSVKSV